MAVLSSAELIAWAAPGITTYDQTAMDACIAAAQSDVERITGLSFDLTQRTDVFNGDDAWGKYRDTLVLTRSPITLYPPTTALTVTENGTSLTVATTTYSGQSPTPAVVIRNANTNNGNAVIYLYRAEGWKEGKSNISVTYWSGYATAAEVPAGLIQCVKELSWLYFKAGRTVGATSTSSPSHSAQNPGVIPDGIMKRLAAWRSSR